MSLTFNEREERFARYLQSVTIQSARDLKCARLGRVADLRKKLMELLNDLIEERAEALAAELVEKSMTPRDDRLVNTSASIETVRNWRGKGLPFGRRR